MGQPPGANISRAETVAAIEERIGHLPPRLSDVCEEFLDKIQSSPSAADRTYAMIVERKFRTWAGRFGSPLAVLLACCFDLPNLMARFKVEKRIPADTRNLYGNDCRELAAMYNSTMGLEILASDERHKEPPTAGVAGSAALGVFLKELHEEHYDEETLTSFNTLHMVVSNPADGHEMLNALPSLLLFTMIDLHCVVQA